MKTVLIWMAKHWLWIRLGCPCTKCDELPGDSHVYSCHCKGNGYVPMIVGSNHG